MWGVCLDSNAIQDGLFQTVIQYKRKENGEVVIISPKTTYKLDIKHVKELSAPPQYIYGECVSPCNHPDMIGIVCDIAWHFKLNCYFYIINVASTTCKSFSSSEFSIALIRFLQLLSVFLDG